MAAVQQVIHYRKELMAGDLIRIESEPLEVRDKVIRFFHTMLCVEDETIAATCELTGVHMDTTVRKSTPFPAFDSRPGGGDDSWGRSLGGRRDRRNARHQAECSPSENNRECETARSSELRFNRSRELASRNIAALAAEPFIRYP